MAPTFAALLREARIAAGLSQEELAELARVSTSAIGAYEQGVRARPHRETVVLLADALQLTGAVRAAFEAAARGKPSVDAAPTGTAFADNLPLETTRFIGRADQVQDIVDLLSRYRIVTLIGTGGIGKTRVALQVAARFRRRREVCLVELAALGDGAFVVPQLAATIGIPYSGEDTGVAERLKSRDLLLILDNCEHLIDAIGSIASEMARTCPLVTILATSRERLRVSGEVVYRIPALPIPSTAPATARAAMQYAGIELFVTRAVAAEGAFAFIDDQCEGVFEICRRLDGIPLALELAASQVVLLGISELRRRLDEHLATLAGGNRDVPSRQQTLRATLEWSHALLTMPEAVLFRRLATVVGGWTLEGAQHVCAYGDLSHETTVDALSGLVEKSLVSADVGRPVARYRMLEVARAFAVEKLSAANEALEVARRHAAWMADLADRAGDESAFMPRLAWLAKYTPDLDNIRTALTWALAEGGERRFASRIVTGFQLLWYDSGRLEELRNVVEATLALLSEALDPRAVGLLLVTLTRVQQGAERSDNAQRAIRLLDEVNDPIGLASAFVRLAESYRASGDPERAQAALGQAASLYEQTPLARSLRRAYIHYHRASIFRDTGDVSSAIPEIQRHLDIARELGDRTSVVSGHMFMAEVHFHYGDASAAVQVADESLELLDDDELEGTFSIIRLDILVNRSIYRLAAGDIDGAYRDASESLLAVREFDPLYLMFENLATVYAIQHLATVAALRGHPIRAAHLLGQIDALAKRNGLVRAKTEQIGYDLLLSSLRKQLPDEAIAAHRAHGALLSQDAAVELAVADVEAPLLGSLGCQRRDDSDIR